MWEERFKQPGYLFGTEPARFLRRHKAYLEPGATALTVAEGEGRNAVYLAERGLRVTGLESAPSAIEKANALASRRGVSIDMRDQDVLAYDWPDTYDIVLGIFIQFVGPDLRETLFDGMTRAVREGGLIMLHGFAPRQVEYGTGGPPHRENMYDETLLRARFKGWDILEIHDYDAAIAHGTGHRGRAALIDFVARKPETGARFDG